MRKFIHVADTHLRDRQWGLDSRSLDFKKSFLAVSDVMLASCIPTAAHGGDIIDQVRPSAFVASQVQEVDALLRRRDQVMITVAGNHDGSTPHWLEVVTDQKRNRAENKGFILLRNELWEAGGITFFGAEAESREHFIARMATAPSADVLIWHGTVAECVPIPQPHHVLEQDLPNAHYRFGAFGDLHVRGYRCVGKFMYGYPGSTELCYTNEDPFKSVTEVDLSGGDITTTYKALPTRPTYLVGGKTAEEFTADINRCAGIWKSDGSPDCIVIGSAPYGMNQAAAILPSFPGKEVILRIKPERKVNLTLDLKAAEAAAPAQELSPIESFADKFRIGDVELDKLLDRALRDPSSVDVSVEIESWIKKKGL